MGGGRNTAHATASNGTTTGRSSSLTARSHHHRVHASRLHKVSPPPRVLDEAQDLSDNSEDSDCDSSNWLSSMLDSQKVKTIENIPHGNHKIRRESHLGVPISAEELKIRSELGMKIERDLEEEIKEGIYHLALRLHRIFQQRKERDAKEACDEPGNYNEIGNYKNRALSEVNISIRMEGGTKIEIKEVNKEAGERGCPCPTKKYVREGKKFDWEKSLRAGSSPVSGNRSNVSSKQKDRVMLRGKNATVEKKLLQLGWKV